MKSFVAIAVIICVSHTARAQLLQFNPTMPSWKDSIRVAYTDSAGVYQDDEQIFARLQIAHTDGQTKLLTLILTRNTGRVFSGAFLVGADACAVHLEVYSLHKEAEDGTAVIKIYNTSHRQTMPGALIAFEYFGDLTPQFRQEVALYPNKYLVYGTYFNLLSLLKQDLSKPLIGHYLIELEKQLNRHSAPDLLAALCVGYAKTDRLALAKGCLVKLLRDYPRTNYPAFAFVYYDYEYYKAGGSAGEPEVLALCKKIFQQYPDAPVSRDMNLMYYLKADNSVLLQQFTAVTEPLLQERPMNHWLEALYTDVLLDRGANAAAGTQLRKALRYFQAGEGNHFYRMNADRYRSVVGQVYHKLALVSSREHRYADVVLYASAALGLFAQTNENGNMQPALLSLRANAYQCSDNLLMAMEDYKKLYGLGDESAVDSMKRLFPQYNIDLVRSFPDFLDALIRAGKQPAGQSEKAPTFSATDLHGDTINLDQLAGKMVVVNFWGLGCGPCIREMPELNQLVDHYRGDTGIVFIAFAGDDTPSLTAFLQHHPFSYTVVNHDPSVWKDYHISALPVHMVIGKEGSVITRLTGAQENIRGALTSVIDRNR